jgi:hypothetical protein
MFMIISNTCIGANAKLSATPAPVTVVEDEDGEVSSVCPFRVRGLCLDEAVINLKEVKEEINAHQYGEEAQKHSACLLHERRDKTCLK